MSLSPPLERHATDRFTAGVLDGALYHVRALLIPQWDFRLLLRHPQDHSQREVNAAVALLVYALRDGFEGDLRVGMGSAHGYGSVRVGFQDVAPDQQSSAEFVQRVADQLSAVEGRSDLIQADHALTQTVKQLCASLKHAPTTTQGECCV